MTDDTLTTSWPIDWGKIGDLKIGTVVRIRLPRDYVVNHGPGLAMSDSADEQPGHPFGPMEQPADPNNPTNWWTFDPLAQSDSMAAPEPWPVPGSKPVLTAEEERERLWQLLVNSATS